ncbi:MAG: ATP-dependent Clp protease ATP-binding subunit [Eubacteriales bacterium]|nr:ATP-dependent Clp protease ATP-binding subunit [Eubacteriales bacterium]MDD4476441.1 ATP-dependent Clp protease ATP-binding subunit [Eubacteriales bacterium]
MTRIEGEKSVNEGLCIKCAKEMGIKPISDFLDKMGLTEEELEAMSEEVSNFAANSIVPVDDNNDEETRAPAIDIKSLFPGQNQPVPAESEQSSRSGNEERRQTTQREKRKLLDTYCINLTARAEEGKLDKIVGRGKELERVMQILCRRQKNNPCLIGEPGVGKTAVAEALAQKIVSGEVPHKLKNKEVMLVDMTAMVAGTQFRGQFESRMKGLIEETKRSGNIILVIDEVHSIVGAGDAEGGMNAANILKPALSRGEIQLIGATTLVEYRKHIENDAALERRFQPVMINEPSIETSVEILKGIKGYYEKFHGIKIPDSVIKKIVTLSERYITDRYLPDKAIDLMDEASAKLSMNSPIINEIEVVAEKLKAIAEERSTYEAILEKTEEVYKKIAENITTEMNLKRHFDELSAQRDNLALTEEDLAQVIEVWTGIPATNISENEFSKIDKLEETVKSRIIGQDEAVKKVARSLKRSRAGISYKKKPSSFIFAGPTGVGKTELVKVLSKYLFDSPEAMIRLDMSEFMEKHSVSRIIGSPPGYVGYDDAGQLTEKIRRKPYSVVLFDEIEKAHPDVLNILLQILDDGLITDSHGKQVNFENTVIIMTTNAGSNLSTNAAGFTMSSHEGDNDRVMKALEGFLRPEFINRVDEIVIFNRLTKENFGGICEIMLGDLRKVLEEKGISFTYDEGTVKYLVNKGFSEKYGARNLRRLIQTDIEDVAAAEIIENYSRGIKSINVSSDGEKLLITGI